MQPGTWEVGVRYQGSPAPSHSSFQWFRWFSNISFSPCIEGPSSMALPCLAWLSTVPEIDISSSQREGAGLIPHALWCLCYLLTAQNVYRDDASFRVC